MVYNIYAKYGRPASAATGFDIQIRAAGMGGGRVRYIGVPLFTADYGGLTEDDRGRLQFLLPNTFMNLFQK